MANDKKIRLDQLFALSETVKDGRLFLQWVHDIGDWWSHSICVTKYEQDNSGITVPANVTVAHLLGGEGGCIPEDIGGILKYQHVIRQLTGKLALDQEIRNASTSNINPGCKEWWTLFNEEFRSKSN
jgi:hypothetical protein